MRVDRRVSPNQVALWTVYELRNGAGQRSAVVRLACYYGRSTGVNGGQSSHRPAQVRGSELGRPPIFQAGHAGSIPVTRSTIECPGRSMSTRYADPRSDGLAPVPCPTRAQCRDITIMVDCSVSFVCCPYLTEVIEMRWRKSFTGPVSLDGQVPSRRRGSTRSVQRSSPWCLAGSGQSRGC